MSTDEDDFPMDPAESLRLIQRERAEAERRMTPDPRLFLWPWGFAWAIGFTLFFLRFGPDGRVFVDTPEWVPLLVLLSLTMLAGLISGINGARAGRHVSGPSSAQGAMYGISWSIAFTGMSVVLARISPHVPEPWVTLMWAGVMVALVGAMHMAGGAIYGDRSLYGLGIYISVINIVGILIGSGWHSLIIAVLGGAGMILAGAVAWARLRRLSGAV